MSLSDASSSSSSDGLNHLWPDYRAVDLLDLRVWDFPSPISQQAVGAMLRESWETSKSRGQHPSGVEAQIPNAVPCPERSKLPPPPSPTSWPVLLALLAYAIRLEPLEPLYAIYASLNTTWLFKTLQALSLQATSVGRSWTTLDR
ncbi:uncharacterized protein C8Q71DRAFT_862411 [Rhodofomes roseus]|uniref:Uncharacterized protein n=1 Tax=Rhodofomes roseus TaxID=34475 RepID=A0ABQ8K1V1_9APHY|nr:uncharacterized protein C8Q71DRAFT_862411 [Rhodofomes roseus]KAH9830664.1 hypothetical protein C8Q71DRAFT_862411 [Rhodofomes roseus]